jgi:hypothetical protein
MVTLSKKAFLCYSEETNNIFYINDSLKPVLIMNREIKSF